MLKIKKITPKTFYYANSYVLTADGKTAVVIDPATSQVESELAWLGLKAEYVLLTHCHYDHVGGVTVLQDGGAIVLCLDNEKPLIGTRADLFDGFRVPGTPYHVDQTVSDGECFELCGISFKAIHTPGHTTGSTCYLVADGESKYLFTGDTLFEGTIGNTEFWTGDIGEMRKSLKKLASFEDMPVFAGHGEDTTIEAERKNNPFLQDL
jgi:glyoxylase-like metal-dependent hydrolase (beta-lactamase superfamily II)